MKPAATSTPPTRPAKASEPGAMGADADAPLAALRARLLALDVASLPGELRRLARRARAEARAAALERIPLQLYELWRLRSLDPFVSRATTAPVRASGKHFLVLAGPPLVNGSDHRPGQLTLELLEHTHRVTYVYRFRSRAQRKRRSVAHENLTHLSFREFSARRFVRERGEGEQLIALCAIPLPEYAVTLRYLRARGALAVYDCGEEWRTAPWASHWYARRAEDALLHASDAVLAATPALERQLVARAARQVTVLPNGVDTRLYARGRAHPRPPAMPQADAVFTYAGSLRTERVRWDFLHALAEAAPRCAVVLLGGDRGARGRSPPNLHVLGERPDAELPAWFAHSDVLLAPVPPGAARLPPKLLEGLAMGRPLVASELPDLRGLPGVRFAASPQEFAEQVLQARGTPVPDAPLARFVADNAWKARVRQLERLLGV